MSSQKEYYEHLVGVMLKTRGVRFSVAESERNKEKFSIGTIAFLSVYLASWAIAVSMFPDVFSPMQIRALSLVSVVASVSLLVISLFDYAAGRSVYAEKMLQNAFTIAGILRASERELAKDAPDYGQLSKLATEYEEVVSRAGINHTSRDFKIWRLDKSEQSGNFKALAIYLQKKVLQYLGFATAVAFQIMLLLLIVASTIWILLCL